ncbi:MAG TPA: sulfurtransferase TusA family protein [Thermoflexus sp.]|nr:sulfurtransferase TusA family protein [Thermoflexus sp.]
MRIVQTVDLRAPIELCTESPIGQVQQALADLGPGEAVAVLVRGYADEFTVTAWAKRNGYTVIRVEREGEEARVVLAILPG